jgi:hypothetical protein
MMSIAWITSVPDAAALRILLWCASQHQWEVLTIDVRTAFLNAKMVQGEVEPLIAAKPPSLQVEKMYLMRCLLSPREGGPWPSKIASVLGHHKG